MAEVLPRVQDYGSRVGGPTGTTAAMKPRIDRFHTVKGARSAADNSSGAKLSSGAKGFPKLIRNLSNNQLGQREGNTNGHASAEGRKDPVVMDPLSHHLFKRNLTDNLSEGRSPGMTEDWGAALPPNPPDLTVVKRADTASSGSRERKKGVSFLSRFMGNKKKDASSDFDDDEIDSNDNRMEGLDADVFSQPIGFIPRFPAPPKYIKVRSRGKKEKDFGRVFLAQELKGRTGAEIAQAGGRSTKNGTFLNPADIEKKGNAIWAMEFSHDGKYLAAGGRDHMVRVWTVISTTEDRQTHEAAEDAAGKHGESVRLSAPVFKSVPTEYDGHSQGILDLSWSKNNFLLSSSMDKTVRLWHISRTECLCCFKHSDFVTSVQFHPRDDRFFLAGSLDSRLRLWSIPDKSVAFSVQSPDLVTAVAFTPDGKTAIAGCLGGLCLFYDTEGLKIQTQIHVRSAHGKNAKGSKITGIQTINYPPEDPNGAVKLLVTSNDSRVRIYDFGEKTLELKLKGNQNNYSQIHASFSGDARYIVCGSEDRKAYVWSTAPPEKEKDRRPFEMFSVSSAIVTIAMMAPTKTRQLLGNSGDPLYDLCNPPPVTLVDRTESHTSSTSPESRSPTGDTSIQPTPVNAYFNRTPKLEESPAYIERGKHPDGSIIIAADYMGKIKVFRQDCAYEKRVRNEGWDNSSAFSKRSVRRSNSVATRPSFSSKRQSVISKQPSSDRINTWRQSINSMHSNNSSFDNQGRSVSPRKPPTPSITPRHASHFFNNHRNPSISTNSKRSSLHKPSPDPTLDHPPESPGGLDSDPLKLQGDASFMFYDKEIWRSQATNGNHVAAFDGASTDRDGGSSKSGHSMNGNFLGVPMGRERTAVSVLSSEESSAEEEGGEVRCTRCGGGQFMARKGKAGMGLECVKCGAVA